MQKWERLLISSVFSWKADVQNKDRSICSGPSDKAKLTTRSINNSFFSPSQNPVSTYAVPLSGVAQFKTSLNVVLLIHGTCSESNSRHQPYSVWDIFEAKYTERILCR